MSNAVDTHRKPQAAEAGETREFVTFTIAQQLFGIPVLQVQDVLSHHPIAPIPMAPPDVAGSLNLRGRIVTAIDVRRRLGLASRAEGEKGMSIVVDSEGELYSLIVDGVGEVLSLTQSTYEPNPPTLDPKFREYSSGIFRLEQRLLVVLDTNRLLNFGHAEKAA